MGAVFVLIMIRLIVPVMLVMSCTVTVEAVGDLSAQKGEKKCDQGHADGFVTIHSAQINSFRQIAQEVCARRSVPLFGD